jgi:hypothetical protein
VRFVAHDAVLFARAKSNTAMQRAATANMYCHDDPMAPLNKGVVIHQIITGPGGRDQIEFTLDRSAC